MLKKTQEENQSLRSQRCANLKMHNVKAVIKFYLQQNEDYSLRDSISDSFEKLLQSRESQYICDFGEGEVHAIKHLLFAGFCYS